MKSPIRSWRSVGILTATLLGTLGAPNLSALALPAEQVRSTLAPIPVFTITDADGKPLVASVPNATNPNATPESVAGVFMSRQDADTFLQQLRTRNPEVGNNVRVVPVSLAEVNELANQNRNQPNSVNFTFIPQQRQVDQAVTIVRQANPQIQEFNGVPLFAARAGQDQGYLTIAINNQQVIPFFFEREQLEEMVARFRQEQPSIASTIQVQVVPLEGVIQTLQTSDNPDLGKIVLWPSREAIQFVQSLPPAPGATPNPAASPGATPRPTASPAASPAPRPQASPAAPR
jgi:Tic22-like family